MKAPLVQGLLLLLLFGTRNVAAATIPGTTQISPLAEPSSTNPPSSLSSVSVSNSTPVIQGVAQPKTGNNYGLDPFQILGSTNDQGHAGGDTQQPKQTPTNKATETTSGVTSSKSAAPTGSISATTKGGEFTSKTESSAPTVPAVITSLAASMSVPISSASSGATPSQAFGDPNSDSSSASGSNGSWKVIGIGVVTFVGVVLLVLGTAFHDSVLRALSRPFRRAKEDEEVFVPDWRRGSWRFGEDGVSIEKPRFGGDEDEEPRIADGEKGKLAVPLPPISPFPLRRSPSLIFRSQGESGIAGVGAGSAAVLKVHSNNYSVLQSPPPLHSSERPNDKRKSKRKSKINPLATPHDTSDNDAYGGME